MKNKIKSKEMKKSKGILSLLIIFIPIAIAIYYGFFMTTVGFSLSDRSVLTPSANNPSISYVANTFKTYTFGSFGSLTGFPVIKAGGCEIKQYSDDSKFFQVYVDGKPQGTPLPIQFGMQNDMGVYYGGKCEFSVGGENKPF